MAVAVLHLGESARHKATRFRSDGWPSPYYRPMSTPTPSRIRIVIAGRETTAARPTSNQGLALAMVQSDQFTNGQKFTIISDMILSLLLPADQLWFVQQLARNEASVDDIIGTMTQLINYKDPDPDDVALPEPKPARPRKTAAKKRTARAPK